MSDESLQQKLGRNRKPRVHITYEVETGGAQVEKELPFVVGVLGDYSGDNSDAKEAMSKREFDTVDRDNFNEYMANKAKPTLSFRVDNALSDDDSEIAADLKFTSMEDFEPHRVAEQVPAIKELVEARRALADLLSKADRSEELETILEDVLKQTESLDKLAKDLGIESDGSNAE